MKKMFRFAGLFLVLVALFTLTSCTPKTPTDAKEKLEEAGYSVVVDGTVTPAALRLFGVEGIQSVLTATKKVDDETESVSAYYFESKDAAKTAEEKLVEWAENNGKESSFKQSGQWLYTGTEQGMKDFN